MTRTTGRNDYYGAIVYQESSDSLGSDFKRQLFEKYLISSECKRDYIGKTIHFLFR